MCVTRDVLRTKNKKTARHFAPVGRWNFIVILIPLFVSCGSDYSEATCFAAAIFSSFSTLLMGIEDLNHTTIYAYRDETAGARNQSMGLGILYRTMCMVIPPMNHDHKSRCFTIRGLVKKCYIFLRLFC